MLLSSLSPDHNPPGHWKMWNDAQRWTILPSLPNWGCSAFKTWIFLISPGVPASHQAMWWVSGLWWWAVQALVLYDLDSSILIDQNGLKSLHPLLYSYCFSLLKPCCKFPRAQVKFAFSKKSFPSELDPCLLFSHHSWESSPMMCRCGQYCNLDELDWLEHPMPSLPFSLKKYFLAQGGHPKICLIN